MNFIIRSVSMDELERCAQVIREAFGTVAKDFGLTPQNCPTNGAFIQPERLIADLQKGNLMYGLFAAGEMAGFMQLETGREGAVILEKLAVLPELRHNGYGKALLEYAKKKVGELGASRLLAAIIEENAVLKQWYLSSGFIHTGTKVFEHLPFTVGFLEVAI